ncbi:antibiotic acetyltransferase [Clostridium tertium]|uniref:Chloramphenicol acetyltransferase n=1 Tax=Clostridium tertium TaxID=1559 RepID=A0A6N3DWU9_9CLOT
MSKYILYNIKSNRIRKYIIKFYKKIEKGEMWSETTRELYSKWYNIDIGIGSYGGCFNYERIAPGTKIGRYCSFAKDVYIYNANHPLEFITTHPFAYNPAVNFVKDEKIERSKLIIGNDVWIGQNAIVLSKCTRIGDGAVIGAGTIVTKDVPDYAIVVGSPGRIVGYRFTEDEIKSIKESKWWDYDINQIKKQMELFIDRDLFLKNKKV